MVRRWCDCCTCVQVENADSAAAAAASGCGFRGRYHCSTPHPPSSSSSSSSSSYSTPSGYSFPVFLPLITALEVSSFVYFVTTRSTDATGSEVEGHLATEAGSYLIFRPDRRHEVWRFAVYIFVHASWGHLIFNAVIQMLAGIPLELTHGSWRICTIYLTGVLAGSLSTSVFDSGAFLIGASGAVYALMAAHMANIFLNYTEMELRLLKLAAVCTIAVADIGFSLWDQRSEVERSPEPPVSYVAHLTGAAAGLTVGLVVLKRPKHKSRALGRLQWTAMAVVVAYLLFVVSWNVFALELDS